MVFSQEHLSWTFQYLFEDLQNGAALQTATAPRAELSGIGMQGQSPIEKWWYDTVVLFII